MDGIESPAGLRLRDLLEADDVPDQTLFVHESGWGGCAAIEDLKQLTQSGRQDFAALLDAPVRGLRPGEFCMEAVITGVGPGELARFRDEFEAQMRADEEMGLGMY